MSNINKAFLAWSEFEYSLQAYMNHSLRKLNKDPSFEPHPLIKALLNAVHGGLENGSGKPGNYAGLSGDADKHEDKNPREIYAVIINIDKEGFITILEVNDLIIQKSIPIEVIIYLLILSMEFESIISNDVNLIDGIRIVNETIPEINMVLFDNNNWVAARDYFKKTLESGNFKIPEGEMGNKLIDDFMSIKYETNWKDYSPLVRSTIAMTWLRDKIFVEGKQNVYISSIDECIPKSKFIRNVKEFLFGKPSEYFSKYLSFNNINLNIDDLITNKNLKRNDKCSCGSGKKYKKCCMIS